MWSICIEYIWDVLHFSCASMPSVSMEHVWYASWVIVRGGASTDLTGPRPLFATLRWTTSFDRRAAWCSLLKYSQLNKCVLNIGIGWLITLVFGYSALVLLRELMIKIGHGIIPMINKGCTSRCRSTPCLCDSLASSSVLFIPSHTHWWWSIILFKMDDDPSVSTRFLCSNEYRYGRNSKF